MTDARARAEKDAPTFDRRKLLKVGAWAAPALLVAAAVPAASASGTGTPLTPKTPTFNDYFAWQNEYTLATNYNAFQLNYNLLRNSSTSIVSAATSAIAVTNPAGNTTQWVAAIQNGGSFTLGPGQTAQIGFDVHTAGWTKIPAGTYSVSFIVTWVENGKTISVMHTTSVTAP